MKMMASFLGSLLLFATIIALTGGYVGRPAVHIPEGLRDFFICFFAVMMVIPTIVATDRRLYQGRERKKK